MAMIDIPVFFLGGCFGGAIVWHFKPFLQTFWRSAQGAIDKLKSEAAKLQAKADSIKAAVK